MINALLLGAWLLAAFAAPAEQIVSPLLPSAPSDRPALQACLEKAITTQTPVTSLLGVGSFHFETAPHGGFNTKVLSLDVIENLLPLPPTYALQLRALENGPWVQDGLDTGLIHYTAPSIDTVAWLMRTNSIEGTIYLVDLTNCSDVLRQ